MKFLYLLLFIFTFSVLKLNAAVGCSTYNGLYPNSNNTINPGTGNPYYKNTDYILFRTYDQDPNCGIRNNKITSLNTPCDVIGVRDYGVLVTYSPSDNNCVQVPFDDYVMPAILLIGSLAYFRIRQI